MGFFGTISAVVLQIAFRSPPVAMVAYCLKSVFKEWSMATIFRGVYDFMWIQVLAVALVLAFPQIAMWLPGALEDAPRMAAPVNDGEARDALELGDRHEVDATSQDREGQQLETGQAARNR